MAAQSDACMSSRPHTSITRRGFLIAAAAAATTACGGGGNSSAASSAGVGQPAELVSAPSPTPAPVLPPPRWVLVPAPLVVAGDSSSAFDLNKTLPTEVRKGGRFTVDPSGVPLPAGVTLSPDGILSAEGASAGVTTGVVFAYSEPT
jgi:hypothetical protein